MTKKILMLVGFVIVVTVLVGCGKAGESNPSAGTNEVSAQGATSVLAPGNATWNNTNASQISTNRTMTNYPGGTNL